MDVTLPGSIYQSIDGIVTEDGLRTEASGEAC